MTDPVIQQVLWSSHKEELRLIRQQVFIDEQGVSREDEWDDEDHTSTHFIAYWKSHPVGTVRLQPNGKIGRMAVISSYRGRGLGKALLKKLLLYAEDNSFTNLFLHAQSQVVNFYKRFGFKAHDEIFMEADIPHQLMILSEKTSSISRFETPEQAKLAIQHIIKTGHRFIDILTERFDPQLYNCSNITQATSQLVRHNPHAQVRVLVKDSRYLNQQHHSLVSLIQRLPSRMAIRLLTEEPSDKQMGFCILDREKMVYFNDEPAYIGFLNESAKPEARHFLDEFNYLWESYSVADPNLRILNL